MRRSVGARQSASTLALRWPDPSPPDQDDGLQRQVNYPGQGGLCNRQGLLRQTRHDPEQVVTGNDPHNVACAQDGDMVDVLVDHPSGDF